MMRHHGWLLLLGALCALGPLSIDMYLPGAPAMARELATGNQGVQLSIVSYLMGLVVGQLIYGPISDHLGRKPPLYIGLTLYAVSSAVCGVAQDIELFVALRFVQGLGACVGMVTARAVVRDRTDTAGAARAFSLLMLVVSAAPLLSPLLGAALLKHGGWRHLFGAMTFFGVFCLIAIHFCLQETHPVNNAPRLSWSHVLTDYFELLQDRKFVSYTLCSGLLQGGMYAYISGSAFVLINIYGVTPQQYSWIFSANSLGMIIAAQINALLLSKFKIDHILAGAMWLSACLGLLAISIPSSSSIWLILVGPFLFLSSIGFVAPNAAAIALSDHGLHAGAASALMGTILFAIGALSGLAVAILHVGPERAMLTVMATCGIGAAWVHYVFAWRRSCI